MATFILQPLRSPVYSDALSARGLADSFMAGKSMRGPTASTARTLKPGLKTDDGPDHKVPVSMKPRASGSASGFGDNLKSLFRRALVWINSLVTPRVANSKISAVLLPFIQKATNQGAAEVTVDDCDALNVALEAAFLNQPDAQDAVHAVVRQALTNMSAEDKAAFRLKLGELNHMSNQPSFSDRVWERLYSAVTASLAQSVQSVSQDGDYYVLEALKQIAKLKSGSSFSSFNTMGITCAFLVTYVKLFKPDKDSSRDAFSPTNQMARISASSNSSVKKWFNARLRMTNAFKAWPRARRNGSSRLLPHA